MRLPFRGFWGQRTARAVAAIAGGSALGQLLALIALPFISRAYSPTELGVFTIINASATILSAVITFRLERALALPREETAAQGLAVLAFISIGVSSSVLLIVSVHYREPLAATLGIPEFSIWVWSIPTLAALIAIFVVLNQLAVRHERYRAISIRNAVQPASIRGFQLIMSNAIFPGLVVGALLGRMIGILGLLRGSGIRGYLIGGSLTSQSALALARRYWRFPFISMPSGLLNVLNLTLPPILIGSVYSVSETGQFGMAYQLVNVPVILLGAAVGQVFLGKFAKLIHDSQDLARVFFLRASAWLACTALAVGVSIWLGGTLIIPIVLGDGWDLAGNISSLLCFAVAGRLVAAPLTSVLSVLEAHRTLLALNVVALLSTLIIFGAAEYLRIELLDALLVYSLSQAMVYVLTWIFCLRGVHVSRG